MQWMPILALILLAPFTAERASERREPVANFETSGGVLAVSPTGKLLAVGADCKGALKLFDLATNEELATLDATSAIYLALDFSPDGKLLAALRVSYDPAENNLSVWDIAA